MTAGRSHQRSIELFANASWVKLEDESFHGVAWLRYFSDTDGRLRIGTVVVDSIGIGVSSHQSPVTMETLRHLKLVEIERVLNERRDQLVDAIDMEPTWIGKSPINSLALTLGRGTLRAKARRKDGRRFRLTTLPPDRRLTDTYLAQVVRAYHAAVEAGKPPAPTIAEDVGAPVRTVRSWIHKARQRGLMPPGRPGHTG